MATDFTYFNKEKEGKEIRKTTVVMNLLQIPEIKFLI